MVGKSRLDSAQQRRPGRRGLARLHADLRRLGSDRRGMAAIEYGLIASLVVIASIGAFEAVANENTGLWAVVADKVSSNMGE